jgi:acylphosphatase
MIWKEEKISRLHILIEGLVQGVGFRFFVEEIAISLNLSGWVRNRWDGSVEVVAEGENAQLEKLLTMVYHGPRNADVRGVKPQWLPATGEFKSFIIKNTSE